MTTTISYNPPVDNHYVVIPFPELDDIILSIRAIEYRYQFAWFDKPYPPVPDHLDTYILSELLLELQQPISELQERHHHLMKWWSDEVYKRLAPFCSGMVVGLHYQYPFLHLDVEV